MKMFNRRKFLKISALSACSLVISTGLSGCGSSDDDIVVNFNHGIASGDPLSDRVIIWTRATTEAKSVTVHYEVATDEAFTDIIHNGSLSTDEASDYTVKVDVQQLEAGKTYYYRFSSNGTTSQVGKMKTLPEGSVERVKMAVFSCANYPNGYFNAYMEASKLNDLDVSVHLGDYIYEYGTYENDDFEAQIPAYATQNAEKIGRTFPEDNNTECLTLNDYRKRYALYHTDAGLQALHQAAPMIAVWDDHEIANDTYKNGAENHDETEGDFEARTTAALQAYFEWLPIRPITNQKEIYRSFEFGDLVSLNMLETRLLARDKQLNYGDYFTQNGDFLSQKFIDEVGATDRSMMGASQLQWLQGQMAASSATWQVLGQQVLMGRMNLPAEILILIGGLDNPESLGLTREELLAQISTSLGELAKIKGRVLESDPSLTPEEIARVETVLPYNLDAWDGYQYEREVIFGTAKAYNKNLVVLAGDTHNSWANNLKDMNGQSVGIEFATTSVSSPGLEEYLNLTSLAQTLQTEAVLELLIDDLKYANLNNRGFMEVVYTPTEVISNWYYVDTNDSEQYSANLGRNTSWKATLDSHTLTPLG